MRKVAFLLLSAAAVSGGAVFAAEFEVDTDFMQSVDETNKSLSSDLASRDAKSSRADLTELQDMFTKVEGFYTRKGDAADAVELSRKTQHLAEQVGKQVDAKDFDGATATATDLSRTCKACHNFYKKS